MEKEILFEMKSPYRDNFNIYGYWFGKGEEETVAIVGSMRGDEIQQQYICARMVAVLQELEDKGKIVAGKRILVIPSCNPFSMNVSKRFWAMDGTDINRMFPGYDLGETTQRIAAALFERIKGFKYGMQMASFYMPGNFVPHVRMLKTGYEDTETASHFGFPYVTIRKPLPYDTTLLNYNWQIWGCKAFSVYSGLTGEVSEATSNQTVEAILRFLKKEGVIDYHNRNAGYESVVLDEAELHNVVAKKAGLFICQKNAGDHVEAGESMAQILDPYDCSVLEEVVSPVDGVVFFAHNKPLALEHSILYRIIKEEA